MPDTVPVGTRLPTEHVEKPLRLRFQHGFGGSSFGTEAKFQCVEWLELVALAYHPRYFVTHIPHRPTHNSMPMMAKGITKAIGPRTSFGRCGAGLAIAHK